MHLGIRKILLAALLAAYAGQTALVYADDTTDSHAPLGPLARRGHVLWHQHNCQVCHQLYGYGGFLGPDLTNAAERLTRERLDQVLAVGNDQMPAYHMHPRDIDAVEAFLAEISLTGRGVPRRYAVLDKRGVMTAVADHVRAHPPPAAVERAWRRFSMQCTACHVLFQSNDLGPSTAPDLTMVFERLDDDAVLVAMEVGRPDKGMPPSGLGSSGRADMLAFLHWTGQHRKAIAARIGGVDRDQGLPWWEYR